MINRPHQVWASDITYVPLARGFAYRAIILDGYSRKERSGRLSNTLEADACVQALEAAIQDAGVSCDRQYRPGSQFTGAASGVLQAHGIRISTDGQGCYRDNIFVERLWRTVKYAPLYTRTFGKVRAVRDRLGHWFNGYNQERFHQRLDNLTPDEVDSLDPVIPQAA